MSLVLAGQFLPLCCSDACGHRKGEDYYAKANNLGGVRASDSFTPSAPG